MRRGRRAWWRNPDALRRWQMQERVRLDRIEQKPAEPRYLPRWGALLVLPAVFGFVFWLLDGIRAPADLIELVESGPVLAATISALILGAASWLGEVRELQPTRRIEVLYFREPPWLPGETTAERNERLSSGQEADASACQLDSYRGRVISVRDVVPGYLSLSHMADKDRLVTILEVTDGERKALSDRTMKIDPATQQPVVVTLDERFGATLVGLTQKYGSREAVEVCVQAADVALTDDVPDATRNTALAFEEEVVRLCEALPRNVAHTGTGNYFVKKTPTQNDDTQNGPPVGQVITLTTGGLGTDAFIGGYITNVTETESYAIVSHTVNTVTLEGNLTNWTNGDDLDIYDSWSAIQAAADQLWTDQGATLFGATQYIRVFAGTYTEDVVPNAGFAPRWNHGKLLIIEGDPADDRDNIILQALAGIALDVNFDQIWVRHMKLLGTGANRTLYARTGSYNSRVSDCRFEGGGAFDVYLYHGGLVEDCVVLHTSGDVAVFGVRGMMVRRTLIILSHANGEGVRSNVSMTLDSVIVSGGKYGVNSFIWYDKRRPLLVRNCTFYNVTNGIHFSGGDITQAEIINTIFKDVDYPYRSALAGEWPYESAGHVGPDFVQRNNCYHNYIAYAYDGTTPKSAVEWAAMNQVDASGELDATDPLMTNPGAGDFSLQTNSPCRHAGHGSGVVKDINGDPFDPYHPDIGSVSTGIGPNVAYST